MAEIDKLLEIMAKHGASDLHLKANSKPILRMSGSIREINTGVLTPADIKKLTYPMLNEKQVAAFEETGDMDCAYEVPGVARFRVNLFMQRGSISMAARRINSTVPSFEDLGLPAILAKVALYHQGLVLVCGITGSGKSTTMATMIQHINKNRRAHIITLEDPIEYMYVDDKSIINQREVGIDVMDFKIALRTVVRQDPDVILLGELRDAETIESALTAAETGHLVFGTLHSSTVPQTFGRIYDIFPAEDRDSLKQSMMFNLRAIICQKLAPTVDGKGRAPVHEIMIMNPTMQKLIEKGNEKKIGDIIRINEDAGMCDFNQSLFKLIKAGKVTEQTAFSMSHNPEQLKMNLKGIFLADSGLT